MAVWRREINAELVVTPEWQWLGNRRRSRPIRVLIGYPVDPEILAVNGHGAPQAIKLGDGTGRGTRSIPSHRQASRATRASHGRGREADDWGGPTRSWSGADDAEMARRMPPARATARSLVRSQVRQRHSDASIHAWTCRAQQPTDHREDRQPRRADRRVALSWVRDGAVPSSTAVW